MYHSLKFIAMIKQTLILVSSGLLLMSLAKGPVVRPPWNEEKTDSLGSVMTAHSYGDVHSTIHYDLTRFLAIKMGLSADTAEIIARFCALVDQINPKADYPYSLSLNTTSIPDTFPNWPESLAGTERGGVNSNAQNEYTAQYWHFPFRDPADTLTGQMTWGTYPVASSFQHFTGPPHFWRVPITYNLKHIMEWALYNGGQPGLPDQLTPVEVMYTDATHPAYTIVQPNSIQAFGIFLHSVGDTYSHEECMVTDTIRAHPESDPYCGLTYHSEHEFAYDADMRAKKHADSCIHAIWRCLREFKRVHNITTPAIWTGDDNGFQDGDGIPDQLEDDGDADVTESFLELWKNPATTDLNGDGVINHSDHTTWRIHMCNVGFQLQTQIGINADGSQPDPSAVLDVKSTNRGMLIPRITTASRDLIPSPANGLLIYNTTSNRFNYFNGTYWYEIQAAFITSSVGTLNPGGGVSINTSPGATPENCAMLDVNNPDRGILVPATTPDLVLAPATGLIIYNIGENRFNFYNGTQWMTPCAISTGTGGAGGSQSQAGMAIRTNDSGPHESAILDISAADKGVLIPRLTNAQREAILPVPGLVIYNTESDDLEFYNGTSWYRVNTNPATSPVAGTHVPMQTQITWNWNIVADATGYKWNTTGDYASATDLGALTTHTESGLACSISYARYAWAYNDCGHSLPVILQQATLPCFPCGQSVTISHVAGAVAPVDKTVTYGTVSNIPGETAKCWITSNLGATGQAGSVSDATEASAGWYWQFNRRQGYKHDGVVRTPNSTWITSISEDVEWGAAEDPCALELGNGWRIPTKAEWTNVDASGSWTNWNGPWNSGLKLHAAGNLTAASGSLTDRGVEGGYWSNKQNGNSYGWYLHFNSGQSTVGGLPPKAAAFPLRCIRE